MSKKQGAKKEEFLIKIEMKICEIGINNSL